MAARVCLSVIPYADKALCDLGTFAFVASHLFSTDRRHSSAVAEILRLNESLEELHTEVQGVISSPRLAMPLLYNVSRRWRHYLNRCAAASASEVVEAPGGSVPFFLEPMMVDLELGRYTGPTLPPADRLPATRLAREVGKVGPV